MNKKGFVLVETITVILVVIICMLGLYKSFSFIFQTLKQNQYYDNIDDIYKINVIRKSFENVFPTTEDGYLVIDKNTCTPYMNSDCTDLYELLEIERIIYIDQNINDISPDGVIILNTDVNYFKTLQNGHKYLIINYRKNNINYYTSLNIGDII